MQTERTIIGLSAEGLVCDWLSKRGYKILDRNWRRPWGELDIVAELDKTIHFIEVKASSRNQAGFEPFLRANSNKMQKVRRTAQTWLISHHFSQDTEWQLDIASVIMEGNSPNIELFENEG
jgi:putative endonuclease